MNKQIIIQVKEEDKRLTEEMNWEPLIQKMKKYKKSKAGEDYWENYLNRWSIK